jgi:hypothetical protein
VASGGDGLTAAQARAARSLLGWPTVKAASAAGLTAETVERIEDSAHAGGAEARTKLRRAFEAAGAAFIPADGDGGEGVRLRSGPAPGVIDAGDLNASNDE